MKKMFFFLIAFTVSSTVFSQRYSLDDNAPENGFRIGINAALPTESSFKALNTVGFGGFIEDFASMGEHSAIFIHGGYTYFLGKDFGSEKAPGTGILRVLLGGKLFAGNFGIGGGIGVGSVYFGDGGGNVRNIAYSLMMTYNISKVAVDLSYNAVGGLSYPALGVSFQL